jgi:hypothetical protein
MNNDMVAGHMRLLDAALLGERFALMLASLGLMAIFWKSAFRYFACFARRRPVIFADQLAAGIYLTAAGMVFGLGVRMCVDEVWSEFPLATPMMIFGVAVILLGYILHFAAWASVVHPTFRHMSHYWTIGLALTTAAGMALALRLF